MLKRLLLIVCAAALFSGPVNVSAKGQNDNVSAVATADEIAQKIDQTLNELIERGEITPEQAKKAEQKVVAALASNPQFDDIGRDKWIYLVVGLVVGVAGTVAYNSWNAPKKKECQKNPAGNASNVIEPQPNNNPPAADQNAVVPGPEVQVIEPAQQGGNE